MEAISAVLLVIGGVQCFFGYRIFRILTAVMGFVVGAAIGGALGFLAAEQAGALAFGLLLGVLCAFLAYKLYKLGVFVICFGAGAIAGGALGLMAGDQNLMIPCAAITGLLLGVLGVIVTKPLIIISTSVGGGMGAGMALGMMLQKPPIGTALGVVLAVAGILVQFMLDKKREPASGEGEATPEKAGKKLELKLPSLPKAGERSSVGEGLKSTFASLKTGASELGQKVDSGARSVANSQAVRQLRGAIDNTKTTHSLSGWNELTREENPLWARGLPVVVNEVRIVAQAAGERVSLALGFQNLSSQDILGVFFGVKCYDLLKQELEGIGKLAVQDFRLAPGGLWFSEQPFLLPDKDTRRVELTVKNVVFADGSIWSDGADLTPLAAQPDLDLPPELAAELVRACRAHVSGYDPEKIFRFQPQREEDHWCCACGQMNLGETCLVCGIEREVLFDLARPERLGEIRQARLDEQKRLEEERRQKIAEQTEAAKQKAAEVSAKTAETLKKGLDKGAELGKQTGDVLNKGLNKGTEWSKQAGDKVKAFWAEKIEPNKRNIAIVACVFVAVLAVFLGTLFGLRAYRAGQEEKAQFQVQQEAEERRRQEEEERKAAMELAEWEAQYFFPYSDKEPISESVLSDMNEADLELAKYEILARHGRVFSTPEYARYFEGKPWYKPDSAFDENAAGALSDIERANMERIDAALAGRKNAQAAPVARAMLAKLKECPSFDPLDGGRNLNIVAPDQLLPMPQAGTYYWTGIGEDPGSNAEWKVGIYWLTAVGDSATFPDSGTGFILSAKVLDMDRNGVPELLLFRLTDVQNSPNFSQHLTAEFWESDGAGGVKMTHSVDLTPALPGDWMDMTSVALVSGGAQDYLRIESSAYGSIAYYAAGQESAVKLLEWREVYLPSNLEQMEPDYYTYYIDGAEVSEAEYRAEVDRWGSGTLLANNSNGDFPEVFREKNYSPVGSVGCFRLDLNTELEAAREYLTQLANK